MKAASLEPSKALRSRRMIPRLRTFVCGILCTALVRCAQSKSSPFEPRPSVTNTQRGGDSVSKTATLRKKSAAFRSSFGKGPEATSISSYAKAWPCGDSLDRRLLKISLPVIANFAIAPLVGAIDLFWVNQMRDPLAVAGQSASNQIFNSVFFLTSFLPSVTATLIAKEHARSNAAGVQDAIGHALFVGFVLAAASTALLLWNPDKVLRSVLNEGAPALGFAKPYLLIRSFSFMPALVSLVGFSAFRGMMDTVTPVRISLLSNLFHIVLDPVLIFATGLGVSGAAATTLISELVAASAYLVLLKRRNLISGVFNVLLRPPTWSQLQPLIRGGAALQLRNLSLNLTFLAVARVVQSIDETGVAAAAHALSLQTFQLGGIVFLAMSTVSQVVIPNEVVNGGKKAAKAVVRRLMSWGLVLGVALGSLQLLLIPVIQRSSPLAEVRAAARVPAILASVFQVINGVVFIGEGVMVGTGSFMQLSCSTLLATIGCLLALRNLPARYGLVGVWLGFGVFNTIRLLGVVAHQRFTGPLARKRMNEDMAVARKPLLGRWEPGELSAARASPTPGTDVAENISAIHLLRFAVT